MIEMYSLSSRTELERLARSFFEEEGRPCGRELNHWLRAEEVFREALNSQQQLAHHPPAVRQVPGQAA
jgi:hypothetical protein